MFHAFKWPAALLGICAVMLVMVQPLTGKSRQDGQLVKLKQSLNLSLLQRYGWMSDPQTSVDSIITNNKLNLQTLTNANGIYYTGNLEDFQKLETLGVLFSTFSCSNNVTTAQPLPLPRINL
jgi:hypothetical protein